MCVPLFLWLENDEAGERVKNFFVTLVDFQRDGEGSY